MQNARANTRPLTAAAKDNLASQFRAIGISAVAAALAIGASRPPQPAGQPASQPDWMRDLAA